MAENSAIEWCDHTFNPWEGCQKVSPGCDHCYAETRNSRYGGGTAPNWGPGAPRRRTSAANWRKPLAWQRGAATFMAAHGRRQRVFCASLADVFDNAADPVDRTDLFHLIWATPDLDWLLLTKRIGNAAAMATTAGGWPPNVWLGATVVNQAEADRDVPKLLATAGPRIRFLSMEPLLGPVDLTALDNERDRGWAEPMNALHVYSDEDAWADWEEVGHAHPRLDWIIVGGESGPGARPMHPDWARSLRDQCAAAGVPFLFKQWGEWTEFRQIGCTSLLLRHEADGERYYSVDAAGHPALHHKVFATRYLSGLNGMVRVGKKAAGRLLDGVQHDGVPTCC